MWLSAKTWRQMTVLRAAALWMSAPSWAAREARLTPIGEYYDFLSSLKGQPLEKLVVATIVGQKGLRHRGRNSSM